MIVKKHPYNSYKELLMDLMPKQPLYRLQKYYIFRGQATDWKLIPTALREDKLKNAWEIFTINSNENSLSNKEIYFEKKDYFYNMSKYEFFCRDIEYAYLKYFYIYANNTGLKLPKTNFKSADYSNLYTVEKINKLISDDWLRDDIEDLAALAQHYGVPTRLLDWSFDIYVALYFASSKAVKMIINNECNNTNYLVIWVLAHDILEDTIEANPQEAPPIRFVIPNYSDNPNICAQKGILSYWKTPKMEITNGTFPKNEVCREPLDILLKKFKFNIVADTPVLYKFMIPISESLTIFRHVSSLGYNAATMFPGYYGIKQKIDEDIMMKYAEHIFEEKFPTTNLVTTAARNKSNDSKSSTEKEKMNKLDIDNIKKATSHNY